MTFLEKYKLLKKSIPVPAVDNGSRTVDSEYADNSWGCKNCYYAFVGFYIEDSLYIELCAFGNKIVDCSTVTESEKCYESVDCNKCHSSTYLMDCNSCTDCHFSALLNSCSDCFGCVGLTHKKYCIFNKQYTKEEYFKKIAELRKENPEKILSQMLELEQKIPHPASQQANSENCPYGDHIYNSKSCYWTFNTLYAEYSGYNFNTGRYRHCWDMYCSGATADNGAIAERCYELVKTENCYECAFLFNSENCANCYYGAGLRNCSDCFGCVGLTKKKYCILNNQFTKEQYEKAVKDFKKELGWKF